MEIHKESNTKERIRKLRIGQLLTLVGLGVAGYAAVTTTARADGATSQEVWGIVVVVGLSTVLMLFYGQLSVWWLRRDEEARNNEIRLEAALWDLYQRWEQDRSELIANGFKQAMEEFHKEARFNAQEQKTRLRLVREDETDNEVG